MVALAQSSKTRLATAAASSESKPEYRLFWRLRATGVWRTEAYDCREEAFDRFFHLLGKGIEIRWGAL